MTQRETYLSDSHNTRQKDYAEKVVRGSILSSDGVTLARTDVDEEGNETRVYPYENMFAHVVGYLSKGSSGLEASENYQLLESHANPLEKLRNEAERLRGLLTDEKKLRREVTKEIRQDIDTYGDERRTLIEEAKGASIAKQVIDEPVTVIVSEKASCVQDKVTALMPAP